MTELLAPRFEDKVAVVTGGGRGIGLATARQLGREGATVYLAEMDSSLAVKAVDSLCAEGIQADYVRTDVSNLASVKNMVDTVVEGAGRVDVLINNAGITRDKSFLGMSEEQWQAVMGVHLGGTFFTGQAVAREMVARGTRGSIVNMASISAEYGNRGQANYTAAKGGIISLTRTMAKELAPKGIRVNALLPGFVDTEMVAGMTDEVRASMAGMIPLGRLATAANIADACCFLASDQASYITGTTLKVDGGLVIP